MTNIKLIDENKPTWTTNHSMTHPKKTMGKLMVNDPHPKKFPKLQK
jgi:hypothetical protein